MRLTLSSAKDKKYNGKAVSNLRKRQYFND